MYGECECFVMQMLYVCVLCAFCGSSQCCVLHGLQFVNAGRGCNRRPYRRGILQSRSHNCFIGSNGGPIYQASPLLSYAFSISIKATNKHTLLIHVISIRRSIMNRLSFCSSFSETTLYITNHTILYPSVHPIFHNKHTQFTNHIYNSYIILQFRNITSIISFKSYLTLVMAVYRVECRMPLIVFFKREELEYVCEKCHDSRAEVSHKFTRLPRYNAKYKFEFLIYNFYLFEILTLVFSFSKLRIFLCCQ